MAGLEQVARLAACGELTPDLYSRYRQVLAEINEAASILDRLDLSSPQSFRNR